MILNKLWLNDFRSYSEHSVEFDEGLTALVGNNGVGKTNLVEAIAYLSRLKSFRGSPTESLVKKGSDSAVLRAQGVRDGREVLIEIQLRKGRSNVQVNRQKLKRSRDLLGALQVTVFSPDDLSLIKEGPAGRRDYLDDLLVALDPHADSLIQDLEKIIKQRNALLKQSRSRPDASALDTLDVWDKRLDEVGEKVVDLRRSVVSDLLPLINDSCRQLSGDFSNVEFNYKKSWSGRLIDSLIEFRENDLRRAVTSVGPHRDDLVIVMDSLLARNEASQGEQRTLALAMRLSAHSLITNSLGEPPLLLLDDVLSELDNERALALLSNLPKGQTVISSATKLPDGVSPDLVLEMG